MPIAGKVYIVPQPDTQRWRLVVHNTGDRALGVTNNIFPPGRYDRLDQYAHDDHVNFGHGLLVQPGSVSYQEFNAGHLYNGQADNAIREGSIMRVGLRGVSWQTVELPPLDGDPLEVDLQDFVWYGGDAHSAQPQTHYMDQYARQARNPLHSNVSNGQELLDEIAALLDPNGIRCEGMATVTAVEGPGRVLSHWEVRYRNDGEQPFIGTVSFANGNKNDGLGLEAMAVPDKTCEAVQRIEALGNYGDVARPGATLRLGVRGLSWTEVDLPARGSVEIPIRRFRRDSSSFSDEYFNRDRVIEKRNEKRDKVQFFENGQPLNEELRPKTWRGAEALARSTFDPPRVSVEAVEHSDEYPGGGWLIEVESRLPQADDRGAIGFVTTLRVGNAGWDPAQLPPKKLTAPGEKKQWFLPRSASLNGEAAEPGSELHVGTRGLGWLGTIALPEPGARVESDGRNDEVWGLREDQYNRNNLSPDFTDNCRL